MLEGIQRKILSRQYEFSRHALDQTIRRRITVQEIEQAATNRLEIIEDYPNDKYGPSCLILGFTDTGRPLHVHCSYPERPLVKIITVYEPDTNTWTNYRIRLSNT